MSLQDLGRRVADRQDADLASSDALDRVRARIASRSPPYAVSRKTKWAAVAVLAAAAVLLFLLRPRTAALGFSVSGEEGRNGEWIVAGPSAVTSVHFSDGTHFALSDGARARVESVTPDGAHLAMERGSVSADVVHRQASHWSVFAGPYEVHVTGTQFEVSWEPSSPRLDVHVTRGSVVVSGAAMEPKTLHAGESLVLEPQQTGSLSPAPADIEFGDDPHPTPRSSSDAPRWRQLAAAGKYSDAIDLVQRAGVDRVIATSGPPDLFTLADAARLSGHADIAQKSLTALRIRYPKDSRAPRAAFDLGRLAFDQQHDYGAAAGWFARCLEEDPNGPLDREASGRLIEARKRAGDESGAQGAAKSYLVRHPDGPHAPLAKSMIQDP